MTLEEYQKTIIFPVGTGGPHPFFTGNVYLAQISTEQLTMANVTFEPGCRNNWHIHHAKSGGGQILICVGGRGFYQEEGKDAVEMIPGMFRPMLNTGTVQLLIHGFPSLISMCRVKKRVESRFITSQMRIT